MRCLKKKNEVQHDKDFMAWFGHADNGFRISDDCNINKFSCSDLGS